MNRMNNNDCCLFARPEKLLSTKRYFVCLGMQKISYKFVQHFKTLIVAAIQLNTFLFVFGGKFNLKKNQPIRSHYSSSSILISRGTDLFPEGNFCPF